MATYSIDSTDLTSFGIQVKEVRGINTIPARKKPTEIDSKITSGVLSLSGANDYYVEARVIEVECYLFATTVGNAISAINSLIALLYAPGTRLLTLSYSNVSYVCYFHEGVVPKRLTGVYVNPVVYQFILKFTEINPKGGD